MKRIIEIDIKEKNRILRLHEIAKASENDVFKNNEPVNVYLFKFDNFRPLEGFTLEVDVENLIVSLRGIRNDEINETPKLMEMSEFETNPYKFIQNLPWIEKFSKQISFNENFLYYPSYDIFGQKMKFGVFSILRPELRKNKEKGNTWKWHLCPDKFLDLS
jgi:hypothetical protein